MNACKQHNQTSQVVHGVMAMKSDSWQRPLKLQHCSRPQQQGTCQPQAGFLAALNPQPKPDACTPELSLLKSRAGPIKCRPKVDWL